MQRHYREERRDSVAPKQERFVRVKLTEIGHHQNLMEHTWFQFWRQFQAEIDNNAAISNVTKLSYLKELTVSSVWKLFCKIWQNLWNWGVTCTGHFAASGGFRIKPGKSSQKWFVLGCCLSVRFKILCDSNSMLGFLCTK